MRIARTTPTLSAAPAAAEAAVVAVTALLPGRQAVLDRLAERRSTVDSAPATLMVIGVLRRDDGWPTAPTTLAAVTALLARSVRDDDWLGKSGPGEFVVLLSGPVTAAERAAARLLTALPDLGVDGLTAAAGIAEVRDDLDATEILRRGLASLTSARRAGPGTVIVHREPY